MSNSNVEFISIPCFTIGAVAKHYPAYAPLILMDDEYYDDDMGISVGKCISLEPLPNEEDALEAARIAYLSTAGAIGYTVRGVDHE